MKPFESNTVYLTAEQENLYFFQALSSQTRLEIIQYLKDRDLSVSELSNLLGISPAITTRHIKTLESAGLVESYTQTGRHGLKKVCSLKLNEAQIIFNNNYEEDNRDECTEIDIPICSYSSFDIQPPCGMATPQAIFGRIDDPRYFSAPNRSEVALMWFTSGYLEYPIPTFDIDIDHLTSVEISLEICSEFPGFNNTFLSDIYFYFNGQLLGRWTSPGDFGGRKGRLTPAWWNLGTEFGLLKKIQIDSRGVEIDGVKVSSRPLHDYLNGDHHDFRFKIDCPKDTENPGGCNLFGRHFGDYDQNIIVKCWYGDDEKED